MTRAMIVVILAGALAVGACSPAPTPAPASTPAPSASARPAASATPVPSATPLPADPTREQVAAAVKAIIAKVPFATLVTVDDAGAPHARIVDPFPLEDEFTVWIATTGASRKVAHIARDARVAVTYFDAEAMGYVTLRGTAAIVRDPAEKAKRWKDSWVGFYKDRNRGDDYTLIRVTPSTLEISSRDHGMNNDPVTWKPRILTLK